MAPQSKIYFVQAGPGGPVKIGRAHDVTRRLQTLQTASAVRLILLGSIPGGARVESRLHQEWRRLRLQGEWFRPDAALLEYIARVTGKAPAPSPTAVTHFARVVKALSLPEQ
jgi:hypothetical protein